jgi:hypothetical protein
MKGSSVVYTILILCMWEDGSDAFCMVQVCLYAYLKPIYPLSDVAVIKFQCGCVLCIDIKF